MKLEASRNFSVLLMFHVSSLMVLKFHILAFFSGAVVLVIEILGARILAPYLGTAFFVWVNIIGVILAALSVGYWFGGKLADRRVDLLPLIFLGGAATCALIVWERPLLPLFGIWGLRAGSLAAALLLFAPPSMILGMVSPYLVKLATRDLAHLGQTAGSIFATATLGSILGTFAAGFWLIPHFTIPRLLWGMVFVLIMLAALSFTAAPYFPFMRFGKKYPFLFLSLGLAWAVGVASQIRKSPESRIIFEKDSQYYNIRVHEFVQANGIIQRSLLLDGSTQSARYLAKDTRFPEEKKPGVFFDFPYQYIDLSAKLIAALKPKPERMLALGGGGYSIPEFVKKISPQSDVMVIEIDPEVTAVAKQFFLSDPDIDIKTITADARIFLNTLSEKIGQYDLIYTDAYSGAFSIPGHLATREAFLRMQGALTPDGVIIINIASALEGKHAKLFASLWKTLDPLFSPRAVFATAVSNPAQIQNIIIVANKNKAHPLAENGLGAFEAFRYRKNPDTSRALLLTDDFSPTDSLVADTVAEIYPRLRRYQE